MAQRPRFSMVNVLIVFGCILLALATFMPMIGSPPPGPPAGRAMEILRSALAEAKSAAVRRHKFVAVHFNADGEVRFYHFPEDDAESPIDVDDREDTSSDDARQGLWRPMRAIRSWIMAERVTADGRPEDATVVLFAADGTVLDGARISPRGDRDREGVPYRRLRSTLRLRVTPAEDGDPAGQVVRIDPLTGLPRR